VAGLYREGVLCCGEIIGVFLIANDYRKSMWYTHRKMKEIDPCLDVPLPPP
jgi:hypothetical protein